MKGEQARGVGKRAATMIQNVNVIGVVSFLKLTSSLLLDHPTPTAQLAVIM